MIIQELKNYDTSYIGVVRKLSGEKVYEKLGFTPDDEENIVFAYNNQLMKMRYIGNSKNRHVWLCYGPRELYKSLFGGNFKKLS